MAKKKRFQNPLRTTLQTQAPPQGPTSVAPHQVAHQGSTSTNSLPQGPTPVAPTQGPTTVAPHQVAHQGSTSTNSLPQGPTLVAPTQGPAAVAPHQVPQQTQTSRQYVGRESADSWTVEAIDPQGATKRIKLKYWQVNDLPIGERVIVHFDDQAAAYGEAQGLLAGYIGTLAILSNLFPINFERWSGKKTGMPRSYFDNCFERLLKEQIEVGLTQSCVDESIISPNDVVGRVLGPEHTGRVRCMGMAAVPSNTFASNVVRLSHLSSSSIPWQEKYTNLEGAFKAYLMMKEGRIPAEVANILGS